MTTTETQLSAIEAVAAQEQEQRAKLLKQYLGFLRRNDKLPPGDLPKLSTVLKGLGKSSDDAAADLVVVQQAARLNASASLYPALDRKRQELDRKLLALYEERRKISSEIDERIRPLEGEKTQVRIKLRQAIQNRDDLTALQERHRELFGIEPEPAEPEPPPPVAGNRSDPDTPKAPAGRRSSEVLQRRDKSGQYVAMP